MRSQDLHAPQGFVSDYPECEPILLYRGTERLRIDGIWCVPGEEFLRQMHPAQGLQTAHDVCFGTTQDHGTGSTHCPGSLLVMLAIVDNTWM